MASPNLLKRPFDHIAVPLDGGSQHEDTEHSEWESKNGEAPKSLEQPHPPILEQVQVTEANEPPLPMAVSVGPAIEDANILASGTPSTTPTNKRQRLVVVGQEIRRKEKEIKDLQKAEEKARKDGEKEEKRKVREAQIKAKEEEKIQRDKVREAQIKAKDDEKRKKAEEKNKKEKSQSRLNSFFVQTSSADPSRLNCQNPQSGRLSSTSPINDGIKSRSRSSSPKPPNTQPSEYERLFPPFYVHTHTILAPETRFSRDDDGLNFIRKKIDEQLQVSEDARQSIIAFSASELLHIPPRKQPSWSRQRNTVKDLLVRIHGTSHNPIDLTESRAKAVDKPTALLAAIPVKFLRFAEDVRPPYIGTYTKVSDPRAYSKLRRNPFARRLPVNYDYDSEAEWEEPGEGEDLDSEGEEEVGEDDEEDEMEGFLDDEEAGDGAKRRLVASDLEPLSTGICWENSQHDYHSNKEDLQSFRLDVISETFKLPIDPYSRAYWQPRPLEISQAQGIIHASMDPPRIPLTNISRLNNLTTTPSTLEALKAPTVGNEIWTPATPSRPPKRLIDADTFDAFKNAVAGSDLTKTGLVEILKKRFPKQSKDAIKDTLGLIAERVGYRQSEKIWIIKAAYSSASS